MILSQLKDALSRQEIYAYDAEGKQFDPYLHEAIETIETDSYAPGIVVKQFYKGYKMGDRIIRPAKVQVAKAKQDSSPSTESNEDKK
jgi:molecular chaperone GrpE